MLRTPTKWGATVASRGDRTFHDFMSRYNRVLVYHLRFFGTYQFLRRPRREVEGRG